MVARLNARVQALEAHSLHATPAFLSCIFRQGEDPASHQAKALAEYEARTGGPPPAGFRWMHIVLVGVKPPSAANA